MSSANNLEFTGLYSADFGADGLNYMSAALGSGGLLDGNSITFVQGTPVGGVTPVDAMSGSTVLFSFFYTTTTNAVSGSGDGSTTFNAFSVPSNPAGSQFFNLTVNGDGTYHFQLLSNNVLLNTTVTDTYWGASGPVFELATADRSLVITSDSNPNVNSSNNGIGVAPSALVKSSESIEMTFGLPQSYTSFILEHWTGNGAANVLFTVDGHPIDFNASLAGQQNASIPKPASGNVTVEVVVVGNASPLVDTGVVSGSTYTIYVGSAFTNVDLDYVSGSPGFALNNISYDQNVTVSDLTLNFIIGTTDMDGDTATLADNLTIAMVGSETGLVASAIPGIDANDGVVLVGDSGNDVLTGGSGNDILIGGLGNDVLAGGLGIDTASYAGTLGNVNVDLSIPVAQSTGGAGMDTLSGIENLNGRSGHDTLARKGGEQLPPGGPGKAHPSRWLGQ